MPNKERIKLLVDALRSGEYTQTTGVLEKKTENETSNCCLGVACRVAIINGLELDLGTFNGVDSESITTFDGINDVLPQKVMNWYGFEYNSPHVISGSGYKTTAMALNDNEKRNFADIADAFERTYLTN